MGFDDNIHIAIAQPVGWFVETVTYINCDDVFYCILQTNVIEAAPDCQRESEKEWYFGNAEKERLGPYSYQEVTQTGCRTPANTYHFSRNNPLIITVVLAHNVGLGLGKSK